MRLIDGDALTANVLKWLPPDPCGREEKEFPFAEDICVSMLMEIEEAPTISLPEIIHCRECVRRDKCNFYTTQGDWGYCRYGRDKAGRLNPQRGVTE